MIAAQNKETFRKQAPIIKQRHMMQRLGNEVNASPATNKRYFPHTGSPKVLVLLVEFSDSVFTLANPKVSFDEYLNGTAPLANHGNYEYRNHGSVREYFTDMSGGTFTLNLMSMDLTMLLRASNTMVEQTLQALLTRM